MRRFVLCSLLFILQLSLAIAQQKKIDSLQSLLKTAREDSDKVNILNKLSRLSWKAENYNKGLDYAGQAFAIANKAKPYPVITMGKANAYANIGVIYEEQGNYPEALKNALSALKIFENCGDKQGTAATYNTIGNIYWGQPNYPEALKNQFKALNIRKELLEEMKRGGDAHKIKMAKLEISNSYSNIGAIYDESGKYDDALKTQLTALAMKEELKDTEAIATSYNNIGNVYEHLKNYPEALKNYSACLETGLKLGEKELMTISYMNIGMLDIKIHKLADSRKNLEEGLSLAQKMGSKFYIQGSYQGLAELDSALGNYKGTYNNYRMFIVYRDSLNNETSTKKIVQEQMNYEFAKEKATQQAEQEKKDAITNATKKKQQSIIVIVSIGLLLVAIFSVLLFSRFKITQKQKRVIEDQKGLVEKQKAILEEKNKDILDSITYAKRLQDAILPPLSVIKKYLPESFIFYKPKDIVAGDFYWMELLGDKILIAACDCTGHGVPGAMVSVVCSNALNRALNEFKINDTGKLLDKTRGIVLETFEKSESEVQDGMDISLCAINMKENCLEWSGANNPLWYIHNNELKEITADKQPIGKIDNSKPFTTHILNTHKGDTVYLFSDGYTDQFGGLKGKKFKHKQLQEVLIASVGESMSEQKKLLEEAFENWKGNLEQVDDVLIIGIRV